MRNNPELRSARQDEFIHLGKSHYNKKDMFPKIATYGTHDSQPAGDTDGDTTTGGTGGAASGDSHDRNWRKAFGVSAEWTVFAWGETRWKSRMELRESESDKWNSSAKEADTIYDVTEAYWRVVFFQAVVQLRKDALHARRKEVQSVGERVSAREARRADLLLAQAQVAEAEQEVLKAENGLELSKERLLIVVGRGYGESVNVRDHLSVTKSQLPAEVDLETHPEVKRIRAAQEAALAAERSARAGRKPKLIFRGHIEDSTPQESAGSSNLVPEGVNYQLGAYVTLPAGQQWVGATGRLREALASQAQLAADAEALSNSLRLRIKDAQNQVEETRMGIEVARMNERAAAESLKVQRELASIRNATRADVAKAENDYTEARIGVLRAIYDHKDAQAHQKRELGVLFSE